MVNKSSENYQHQPLKVSDHDQISKTIYLRTPLFVVASKHEGYHGHDEITQCKWGTKCHDFDAAHRAKFSHPSDTKPHQPKDSDQTPCKWGTKCHDFDAAHRAKFSHPKK